MGDKSNIEWTDATWNPVTGCDRVSPGCKNCYALELAPRLRAQGVQKYVDAKDGEPPTSGPAFGVTLWPDTLAGPLRWRKPRMVFVNSMSDLFHPEVPDEFIADVWAVMAAAEAHTFQVLTKRPERMRDLLASGWLESAMYERLPALPKRLCPQRRHEFQRNLIQGVWHRTKWPLPNVWLGTSIELKTYNHRADVLRECPAAVRFISAEPLLGPLVYRDGAHTDPEWTESRHPPLDLRGIHQLIVGGESGANHRPMDPQWVRDLRAACLDTGCPECYGTGMQHRERCVICKGRPGRTAFFFKQWGGRTPKAGGRELDGKVYDELPVAVHA